MILTVPYRSDFAQKATDGWADLLPDLALTADELTAAVRLSRLASIQARLDEKSLAPFDRSGVRSVDDFRCLAYLRRHPQGATNAELTRVLGGSKSGLSNRLDRFAEHDLIKRTDSVTDRRSHTNTLTEKGETFTDTVTTAVIAGRHQLFAALTPDQVHAFSVAMADMIHHVQADD